MCSLTFGYCNGAIFAFMLRLVLMHAWVSPVTAGYVSFFRESRFFEAFMCSPIFLFFEGTSFLVLVSLLSVSNVSCIAYLPLDYYSIFYCLNRHEADNSD